MYIGLRLNGVYLSGVIWKMGLELEDYIERDWWAGGKEGIKVGVEYWMRNDFLLGLWMRVSNIGGICSEIERKGWILERRSWLGLKILKNW